MLLDEDFTDHEHTLGGVHTLVWEGSELIGHDSVVMRRLLHGDRALRTGYVEGFAVRADRRRRGHDGAVMGALERVIRGGYEIGALGTTDQGADFYAARGRHRWTGTTSVIAPDGIEHTEQDEGGIHVLTVSAVRTPDGDPACDWRNGDDW